MNGKALNGSESNSKDKIVDIQLLRGLSILLVLFEHSWFVQAIRHDTCLYPGWIGVELFFVISGFVVVRSFERGRFAVANFAIRRIFRLYPCVCVVLGACLLLNLLQPADGPFWFRVDQSILVKQTLAILAVDFPSASGVSYSNGPFWSLVVELKFYSILALAVLLCRVATKEIATTKLFVAALAGGAYLFISTLRILLFFGIQDILPSLLNYKYDFLALGVLAGTLPDATLATIASRVRRLWPLCFALPLLVVAVSRSPGKQPALNGDTLDSFTMVLTGWAFLLVVVAASQGLVARRCSQRMAAIAQWTGDRSFLLYILHMPCYILCWYALHAIYRGLTDLPAAWVLQPIAAALIMLPIVEVLHRYVEKPGIRLGSALSRGVTKAMTGMARRPDRAPAHAVDVDLADGLVRQEA